MQQPRKYGWRWWKNRKPFVQTIEDFIAEWTAGAHRELINNAK